ncbi:MAG TPA: glycosyltransferase [Halomonas sp.]|nr:glycosyltransferase [Halomonas sp.]
MTFICGGRQVPASRFRVDPIAKGLVDIGWNVNKIYGYGDLDQRLSSGLVRRAYRAGCRLRRAMITGCLKLDEPVVLQRLAWPWSGFPETRLAKRVAGLIFDFDDAVFLNGAGNISRLRDTALKSVFSESIHVVAGNSWLAEYASDYADVSVVPTCIDTSRYLPVDDQETDKKTVIGWVGTSGNFKYLYQLIKPLCDLRSSGFLFDFVICSDAVDKQLFGQLGADFVKWTAENEISVIQSFDIGLMPLHDDDWCRGKCSFKLIQYASVGLPSVGSAVGFNKDVIEDGTTGYLVAENEWYEPLSRLVDDHFDRLRMGRNARNVALSRFDVSVAISAYQELLHKIN